MSKYAQLRVAITNPHSLSPGRAHALALSADVVRCALPSLRTRPTADPHALLWRASRPRLGGHSTAQRLHQSLIPKDLLLVSVCLCLRVFLSFCVSLCMRVQVCVEVCV